MLGSLKRKTAEWVKQWAGSGNPREPPPNIPTNKEFANDNNHFNEAVFKALDNNKALNDLPQHGYNNSTSSRGFGGARQASKWRNGYGIARQYHEE